MDKQICIILLLLIASFQLINAKIITTDNLHNALSQAEPGDTIELKSGTYRNHSYQFKNGTEEKKITIRSAPNAQVYFIGTPSKCIFEVEYIQYVGFEGPMELKDALCGFNIYSSMYINITNISIYNMNQQAILINGAIFIYFFHNIIQGCVLENKETAKTKIFSRSKCVEVNLGFLVSIHSNNISFSYGESIYFEKCRYCYIINNEITNGLFANIYNNSTRDTYIYNNILRVNSTEYNNKNGKACGIAMSDDNKIRFENINIINNIIIGTRIGIYFFTDFIQGTYNYVKILFNTLWNVDKTPILFKKPKNENVFGCVMKNNFIYFNGAVELEPKSAWKFSSNYYYNTPVVPNIYYDSTSKAEQNIPLDTIFNQVKGCENYYDPNLNPECLRPSKIPGNMKLFHSGFPVISSETGIFFDINFCNRSKDNPSIGAFEYPERCSQNFEPTPIFIDNYDVRFNITYCTSGYKVLKIIGSYCNWNVEQAITMTKNNNCIWSATFKNIDNLNFKYKFAETIQNSIYKIESDPFRIFDGKELGSYARLNDNGEYEHCDFFTTGNLITLVCTWR